MNITELDNFRLSDTVKFHDRLNHRLWDGSEHLHPAVKDKLLEIAADFQEFLGVPNLDVKDITISGSNAAYNYTPNSDIDLHLVVDLPEADKSEVFRELFDAKKYQYNDMHNIKIGGYDVELYVQNPHEEHHSQGIYSLLKNSWVSVPKRRKPEVDDVSVRSKAEDLAARIDDAVESNDYSRIATLQKKIKAMRKSGLEREGEYGSDNLAFKVLRNQGYIKKLVDARNFARDLELSLAEMNKPKTKVRYGFMEASTPDGVSPSTKMFLEADEDHSDIVHDFILDTADKLGIKRLPRIEIHHDPEWSEQNKSFGMYQPESHTLHVSLSNRHLLDILRTTAHELAHCAQHQKEALPDNAGDTGSEWENEAHAVAGIIMRDYADKHPDYFQRHAIDESSGYIPTKAEKNDPRFKMALTVDVHPGQTGKEANKMSLKTDAQGKPGLLMKTVNLRESLAAEFESFNEGKSYGFNSTPLSQVPGEREDELGNQEATGPEFPPQMPAGTTKIDVSDLTDWYRLGQDISDMDDADPEDYNQGPPQTVIVFPSDEAEQGYLKQFKRLGLKTHDMDPDVPGGEDLTGKHLNKKLAEEFNLFEEQDLFEIKMTGKNLAQLAKAIPGATVGLEFEMIVPNTSNDYDSGDQEPDYEQDERVRDIDDCVNFFDDGDFNDRATLRRLRSDLEEGYFEWKIEQVDERWHSNQGWEFFVEYLDREEPFDEEDYLDQARDIVASKHPELEIGTDDYEVALREVLDQINATYYTDQWEEQGRNYDNAREEFEDEISDDISESDWLDAQGIRYASDVESNYNVTWPYWTSPETENDAKEVAINFMNYMGYDTIAVGDYHGYGGGYELWNGSEWRKIGSNKPMDAFTVEPDGSLSGDNSGDTGLEFVSPPIPLDQIGETMKRVQQWAAENGVYTGKNNSTSLHTNISIPGYDLDKLDYLKAAILLGDEHVLRQFDRIGNTYAKPAIEKVKNLVQQKPEKAKELLDKMKSQLNAEASKLIHSGQTDKYTSINTKDNRIEFRSPGGDYLSIIADNPQKMIDTINRMVVTLDAAMDPNKFKEEYQKKLYKILTGQGGGREAKSGKKQEMKASDKDLLNIFSRYAAGELPKQALKSFVRQAQLERNVARQKDKGVKMWWNVARDGQRMEVVATNELDAKLTAAKEWGIVASDSNLSSMTVKPLRPYVDASGPQVVAQQPTQPAMGLWDFSQGGFINSRGGVGDDQGRLIGGDDFNGALEAARRNGIAHRIGTGEVDIRPIPQEQSAQQQQGNWGIWITSADRFANQPGQYLRSETPPLYRFPSREAAEQWITQQRAERPGMRTDIEVREIEPAAQPQAPMGGRNYPRNYEIYDTQTGARVEAFHAESNAEALSYLEAYQEQGPHTLRSADAQARYRVRPIDDTPPTTQFGANTPAPMYELVRNRTDEVVHRFFADTPDEAYEQAADFMQMQRWNPDDYSLQPAENPSQFRSTENVPREGHPRNLVPTGPGPWEIYRISNGETVRDLSGITNRSEAEQAARNALGIRGEAPELYGVRTRSEPIPGSTLDLARQRAAQSVSQHSEPYRPVPIPGVTDVELDIPLASRDAAQGGIIDVARGQEYRIVNMNDRSQLTGFRAANQAEAEDIAVSILSDLNLDPDHYDVIPLQAQQPVSSRPTQTQTVPGQPQQQFTGEWDVVMGGEVVFRVCGENQGIANQAAQQWILGRSREFLHDHQGQEVEVVPRYA